MGISGHAAECIGQRLAGDRDVDHAKGQRCQRDGRQRENHDPLPDTHPDTFADHAVRRQERDGDRPVLRRSTPVSSRQAESWRSALGVGLGA